MKASNRHQGQVTSHGISVCRSIELLSFALLLGMLASIMGAFAREFLINKH